MKKGYKKFYADSENFNSLQCLANAIGIVFNVSGLKWGGNWNGLSFERFSFYCTPETRNKIQLFSDNEEFKIRIS